MQHFVARALPGTLLFSTHEEARSLWRILRRTFPEAEALCLMPNHIHLILPHGDPEGKLTRAMAAYARWRNHRRRQSGAVWETAPPPEAIPDAEYARRTVRYVLLNPCRARLVGDPLAWTWSTHRDRVGLSSEPWGPVEREPARFHRYVSSDPSVRVEGTELPSVRFLDFGWNEVLDAVCAVTRAFPHEVLARGPVRSLALRTARAHGLDDVATLSTNVSASPCTVRRCIAGVPGRGANFADPALAACIRVVGDPRFLPLSEFDLRSLDSWGRYRRMR